MKNESIVLDLKNIPCPLNVVKCRLALEKMSKGDILFVTLDRGEPETMVIKSLREMGYNIKISRENTNSIQLLITNELD